MDSSYEQVDQLKNAISEAFADEDTVNLVTYKIDISPADPQGAAAPNTSSLNLKSRESNEINNGTMLAAFYPQDETEAADTDAEDKPGVDTTAPAVSERRRRRRCGYQCTHFGRNTDECGQGSQCAFERTRY